MDLRRLLQGIGLVNSEAAKPANGSPILHYDYAHVYDRSYCYDDDVAGNDDDYGDGVFSNGCSCNNDYEITASS